MPRLSPFLLLGLVSTAFAQDVNSVPPGWALGGSNPAHYIPVTSALPPIKGTRGPAPAERLLPAPINLGFDL
jgi:hypothetical protein